MASLAGATIATTFKSLLKLAGNTDDLVAGASGAGKQVMTGDGESTPIYLNTDRIGIGTASPDRALHVWAGNAGAVSTNANSNMVIEDSGDNFLELASPAANDVGILFADPGGTPGSIIYDHATDNLTIDADDDIILTCENVGIGTATPANLLHLAGADSAYKYISFTNDTTGHANTDGFVIGISDGEDAILAQKHNQDMIFTTNNITRMTIKDAGNVGIGTDSPISPLHIKADFDATPLIGQNHIRFQNQHHDDATAEHGTTMGYITQYAFQIENQNGSLILETGSGSGAIGFNTDGDSRRMTIPGTGSYEGNVGIGTEEPTARLYIKQITDGTQAASHFRIQAGAGSLYSLHMYLDGTAAYIGTPSTSREIRMFVGADEDIGVKLTNGATSWVSTASDRRSKKNINDLESVLDGILKLKPRRFDYKTDLDVSGSGDRLGFISQEVGEVFPYLEEVGAVDDSGEEQMGTVYMGDPGMTAMLVKAIQELSAKVTALENNNEQTGESNNGESNQGSDSSGESSSESSGEDSGGTEGSSSDSSDSSNGESASSESSSDNGSESSGSSRSNASDDSEAGSGGDDSSGDEG